MREVKLKEILTESKIISDKPNPDCRLRVKLNVGGVEKRPMLKDSGTTKYYVRKAGQFIYGRQNLFKGAFGVVPAELDNYESSIDLPTFDVSDECSVDWIIYFLLVGERYKHL
ncbi:MAG TPA: restriction endonuclease subunit S, partial [Epsilonproteobacteria bacterium]|nr:restriction endonuclease subunit S [Campylobacterota bacterium]